MKRLTKKRRQRQIRLQRKREKRRVRITAKRRRARAHKATFFRVPAPRFFTLYDPKPRSDLLRFLRELRDAVRSKKRVLADFSATEKMFVDGTLLMRAEIERMRILKPPGTQLRCTLPHNDKAKQVLKQTGALECFNNNSRVNTRDADVVHWKVATGTTTDGSKYDDVLGDYEGALADPLFHEFYLGITEAMTNSIQHAYIGSRNDGFDDSSFGRRWWMFSQCRDGQLFVAFADLGVGIPNTLPKTMSSMWERLFHKLGRAPKDHEAIEAAIQEKRSRTRKPYRGKGLQQIVSVVNNIPDSNLTIYSNHGAYIIRNGQHRKMSYLDSIKGTIITWSVPLSEACECPRSK